MPKHYLFVFSFFLFFMPIGKSQTSKGTDFTFSFMENLPSRYNGKPKLSIIVSAEKATDGVVTIDYYQKTIPFSLIAGETKELILSDTLLYPQGSDIIARTGINVKTTQPIQLTARHYRLYFSESTIVLPNELLGTEYLITTYSEYGYAGINGFKSDAAIVAATEDNTTIEITLSDTLDNNSARKKNEPYIVKLSHDEVYQIAGGYESKLTGTRIRSLDQKKIAVFSGSRYSTVGRFEGINHIFDQQIPLNMWGKFYAFVPFAKRKKAIIRIVAAEDSTTVHIGCEVHFLLHRGNNLTVTLDSATIIYSDKKISVGQIMRGGQEDSVNYTDSTSIGDPNLQMLLPLQWQCYSSNYKKKTDTTKSVFFANIIVRDSTKHLLRINGRSVDSKFTPFPYFPEFSYTQLPLKDSISLITSNSGFIGYAYHLSPFDATTENLGFDYYNKNIKDPFIYPRFPDTLTIAPDKWCNNETLRLKPIIPFPFDSLIWYFEGGKKSFERNPNIVITKKGLYGVWLEVIRKQCGERKQYFKDIEMLDKCMDSVMVKAATVCTFEAFLNPFINDLEIKSAKNQGKMIHLEIFDSIGRLISQSKITFDSSGIANNVYVPYSSGLYILRYTTEDGQKCFQKVVKAN